MYVQLDGFSEYIRVLRQLLIFSNWGECEKNGKFEV